MTKHPKKILTLVDKDFEDLELWYPILRLKEERHILLAAGPEKETVYKGKNGLDVKTELAFKDLDFADFDGVLIPGGWAPDKLRRDEHVLKLIQYMDENKKLIGQICHAGWVTISAGILKGRMVTSTPAIQDDMINAGAHWIDKEVVVDKNIVSSRRPADLPVYVKEIIKKLK